MRKLLLVSIAVLGLVFQARGQTLAKAPAPETTGGGTISYPMAGSEVLRKEWERIAPLVQEYNRAHPEEQSLKKTTAWNFTVGQAHTWWASDLSGAGGNDYQVPSTCRAVGNHCYIFAEDANWGGRINQEVVDSVLTAFDSRTPADPTKGIYDLDTYYFGNPPDVDNDPKIVILILDIRDGFSGSGGYVAGYFFEINELTDAMAQLNGHRSNVAEIYYVDCNPANLTTASGRTDAELTTAHEFQHMIHYNYDHNELSFVNEGLSESAEKLCGYGLRSPAQYYANTAVQFTSWNPSSPLPDYARAALFTWYMYEQVGTQLAKQIVLSPLIGTAGYNDALSKVGTPLRFIDLLKSFAMAVGVNDTTIDSRYGFKQLHISTFPTPSITYTNPNVPLTRDSIPTYGTRYIAFSGGDSLNATFIFNTLYYVIRAIATGTAGKKITDVTPNVPYIENDFGKGYSKVTFAVTNIFAGVVRYQYSATGTSGNAQFPNELAYDDGNPEGYYQWSTGDSVAVQFDAAPGAVLDSIRVAFRRSGSVQYGIWKYTGSMNPTPFGQNYNRGTMVCTDSTPPFPYPQPYRNWVKTDVSSWNVDLNNPFAIGFIFGANPTAPGLMMSEEPPPVVDHNFTYTNGRWYVITNQAGDSTARYLVRAYIHYGSSGTAQPVEITPKSFELAQNYPNPFNPATVIHYALPVKDQVRLTIYDILGRQVATLVDQVQGPGFFDARWDGTDAAGKAVGSGVYFYRLQSGSFVKTAKMVLLR